VGRKHAKGAKRVAGRAENALGYAANRGRLTGDQKRKKAVFWEIRIGQLSGERREVGKRGREIRTVKRHLPLWTAAEIGERGKKGAGRRRELEQGRSKGGVQEEGGG